MRAASATFVARASAPTRLSPKRRVIPTLRQDAVRHALADISQRKTARLLHVSPQSIDNWLAQAAATLQTMQQQGQSPQLPSAFAALSGGVVEQDKLYTFCNAKRAKTDKLTGAKKQKAPALPALLSHRHLSRQPCLGGG